MRSPNIRYFPAVDHLRAFAALLILFYHGLHLFSFDSRFHRPFDTDSWLRSGNPLLGALIEGHIAVSLFMVLSGFILTYGVLDSDVVWRGFVRNRLLRTYPLFLLLLFVGIAAEPQFFAWMPFLQTIFGLANMPGALVAPPFTVMLWTVAVEWQFYLLFPFLLLVLKPAWTKNVLGLVAVVLVFRALAVLNGGDVQDLTYSTIVGRLDQFLIGMWAAWLFKTRPLTARKGALIAVSALVVIVVALNVYNAAGGWPTTASWKIAWPTVEAVACAAFVIGYVAAANSARGLWSRVLARIGEISYSMYLIHFVVIQTIVLRGYAVAFTGRATVDALLNTVLFALPAMLVLSTLTFTFVEQPFLRMRRSYKRDAVPAAVG